MRDRRSSDRARRGDPLKAQPIYVTIPKDFSERRFVQIGEEQVRFEVLHERVRQAILPRDDKSLLALAAQPKQGR